MAILFFRRTDSALNDEQQNVIENEAESLFGLIHARFIVTHRGLQMMADKFRAGTFGTCPRLACRNAPLLPIGMTELPKRDTMKMWCAACCELYVPKSTRHERTI